MDCIHTKIEKKICNNKQYNNFSESAKSTLTTDTYSRRHFDARMRDVFKILEQGSISHW